MKKSLKVFLIAACFLLLAATVSLTVALVFTHKNKTESETRLNGLYEKSYFDALDYLSDVKLKLDKTSVLQGSTLQSALLSDVWRESELSASSLSQLGTETEELDKILKFLNQLSDYAKYLSVKVRATPLSAEEKQNLRDYKSLVSDLDQSLRSLQEKLVRGENVDASALSDFSLVTDTVKTYSSVDYPEMIYDGPFSDGLNDRETKFLSGKEEVSKDLARQMITTYFPDATEIQYVGESDTTVPSYLFSFTLGRNDGTLALTKAGGYVAGYNAYCEVTDPQLSEEECIEKGNEYIAQMGYENMKAVWVNNNNSTVYINYAYFYDDVVIYPDLVKIKVCSQTGDLIGVEAQNYLYNHTEREIEVDKTVALDIDDSLEILTQTYCIIPTDSNREIAAKELVVRYDAATYYLYYDLSTREEVRCLVVIEDDGRLLQ